ncbi:MAG: cyanovirin [Symploca sp. SIO1A3]|nr:cyanovirin [Symploca sp. SIO1A3]
MSKKNGFLRATVAFLSAVAMSFGMFTSHALALGDFSQTCYNSNVSSSTLSSSCRRIDGSINDTSINLNPYIENVDGTLVWQPNNFIATCRNTGLTSPSIMAAECKTRSQDWNDTSIDLDDHIANINGVLTYE